MRRTAPTIAAALTAAGMLCGAASGGAAAGEGIPLGRDGCVEDEPRDYRLEAFRAPTPCSLRGAAVVHTAAVEGLAAAGVAVLIDVLPAPRRPKTIGEDELWLPPARFSIPGSVWLPNTGFGVLPTEEARYLAHHLERVSHGDKTLPLVFFCESECWMSWNAAKRAVDWGYASVHWYPGGTDAWAAAGLPLEQAAPAERGEGH